MVRDGTSLFTFAHGKLGIHLTSFRYHTYQNTLCPSAPNVVYLSVGISRYAAWDPVSVIKVIIVNPWAPRDPIQGTTVPPPTPSPQDKEQAIRNLGNGVSAMNPKDLSVLQNMIISSGSGINNLWLAWLVLSTKEAGMGDCIACTAARPVLTTNPMVLPVDEPGTKCLEKIFREANPANCSRLTKSNGTVQVGALPSDWCTNVTDLNTWPNQLQTTSFRFARADIFLLCGRTLYPRLPENWRGLCAPVRLRVPITMTGFLRNVTAPARHRRDATDQWDLNTDSTVYMDAIGIPRCVPDRYKLADNIAAGFENIPLLSAIFPVTPVKNVDRINYVHYNVNRMALDMLLAEKGGVCSMFGEQCCTFIPNNAAPDGSVSKALAGLHTLSEQMAEDSGVSNPLGDWAARLFGRWKNFVMSALISIATFFTILITCGCCCIPCARTLCTRLIETTLRKEQFSERVAQMALLQYEGEDNKSDDEDCAVFQDSGLV
ncbi:Endogenous retrovirus group PABLB member 1 Env polyprotein [Merluccius polli]|uniref:Endogenous retrovirus group PABLB member 1 Env polyprotein n=1 Tax=Merluccius polli TaxID=89951 RepID=A0AA47NBW5_MERPO|nr:Endogenous retrovirus group PABLB member 1 Env polyprotein [Merluccius polli]